MSDEFGDLGSDEGAEALDRRARAALLAALGDVDLPAPDIRARHLAAALDAFDEDALGDLAASRPAVTDLATHRRRTRVQQVLAAAAVVLLVGVGVVLAARSDPGTDDVASDRDAGTSASSKTADPSSSYSTDDRSEALTEAAPDSVGSDMFDQSDGATGQSGAPVPSSGSELDAALPSVPPNVSASVVAPTDLGEFATVEELRMAVDALSDPGAGSNDGTVRSTMAPMPADPTVLAACPEFLPTPGPLVLNTATLAGTPVLVVSTVPSDPAEPVLRLVLDTSNCSTVAL